MVSRGGGEEGIWKARTDNKWAVYRGVRELSIGDGVREYGIGRHKVYYHYPREVVRIPEPTEERVVLFLDASGAEGQPPEAGAVAVRVRGVGQVTESVVEKMVYGARVPWGGTGGGGRGWGDGGGSTGGVDGGGRGSGHGIPQETGQQAVA